MSNIKRITIVTSVGVNSYEIGIGGVTKIAIDGKQISSDVIITVYKVMKGDIVIAEISAFCPLEIKYEEEKI